MTLKQLFKSILYFFKDMGILLSPIIAGVSFANLHEPWQNFINRYFITIVVTTLILSALITILMRIINVFKNNIKIKFNNPDFEVEVKFGDLFKEKNNIVVGFNNYFDTSLGEIISKQSVQGQFEQICYCNNVEKLDNDIKNALKRKRVFANNVNNDKTKGKKKQFPVGTTVAVENNEQKFFLCAYSSMNNDTKAESNIKDFCSSLTCLWEELRIENQCLSISIPVMGTGLSRLPSNKMELLITIIMHFIASSREQIITKKLTVVLNKKDKKEYNLSKIETILKEISEN